MVCGVGGGGVVDEGFDYRFGKWFVMVVGGGGDGGGGGGGGCVEGFTGVD